MINIVLVAPEIPQNTGSIARTCAALNFPLHLIEPLSFEIDEKRVRRAGLDYWPYVQLTRHTNWEQYLKNKPDTRIWALSKFAKRDYHSADLKVGDSLVFGSETKGLGEEFLAKVPEDQQLCIPMPNKNVRSLNLSNAVSIVAYQAAYVTGCLG